MTSISRADTIITTYQCSLARSLSSSAEMDNKLSPDMTPCTNQSSITSSSMPLRLRLAGASTYLPIYPPPYTSAATNGFAISPLPSAGEMSTSSVPRATTRPRGRVVSFPSSSVRAWFGWLALACRAVGRERRWTGYLPRMVSLTSSSTRFISWSYPFSIPVTI